MTKGVTETPMKFYFTHLDALLDQHYVTKTVDVENSSPESTINTSFDVDLLPDRYRELAHPLTFRLKPLERRDTAGVKFIEQIYIRLS